MGPAGILILLGIIFLLLVNSTLGWILIIAGIVLMFAWGRPLGPGPRRYWY